MILFFATLLLILGLVSTSAALSQRSGHTHPATKTVRHRMSREADIAARMISDISGDYSSSVHTYLKEITVSASSRDGNSMMTPPPPSAPLDPQSHVTIDASGITSREIDRIIERFARDRIASEGHKAKSIMAVNQVHEMHQQGALTIEEVFRFFEALGVTAQSSDPMEQFRVETRQRLLHSEIAAIEAILALGERNIRHIVARTLDSFPVDSRGGGGGLRLTASLAASVGIGPQGSGQENIIDAVVNPPAQRFDGFVVGETGYDDEFDDLRNGNK